MQASRWFFTSNVIARDFGDGRLSLVAATPGPPRCPMPSIVKFQTVDNSDFICNDDPSCWGHYDLGITTSTLPGPSTPRICLEVHEIAAGKFLSSNKGNDTPDIAVTISDFEMQDGPCPLPGTFTPRSFVAAVMANRCGGD